MVFILMGIMIVVQVSIIGIISYGLLFKPSWLDSSNFNIFIYATIICLNVLTIVSVPTNAHITKCLALVMIIIGIVLGIMYIFNKVKHTKITRVIVLVLLMSSLYANLFLIY